LSDRCWSSAGLETITPALAGTGGAMPRDKLRTNPLAAELPERSCSHSLPQERVERAVDVGFPAAGFPQQQLPRRRQHECADSFDALAASGATDAKDNTKARHADIVRRTGCGW
jgi:hypothetical protein